MSSSKNKIDAAAEVKTEVNRNPATLFAQPKQPSTPASDELLFRFRQIESQRYARILRGY